MDTIGYVISGLVTLIMTGLGTWNMVQHAAILKLQESLGFVRENYVHKDDMRTLKQEITTRFDRLEQILLEKHFGAR